jgi:hypothetical protein
MLGWNRIAAQVTIPTDAEAIHVPAQWAQALYVPRWMMQMVGAFPFRDVPAPMWTYPLAFLVIGLLSWTAWRHSVDRRQARVLAWLVVVLLLLPVAVSLLMMSTAGAFWQGRYELPIFIGILPLCGLLLDKASFAPAEGSRLIMLAGVILVVINVACVVHLQQLEQGRFVSAHDRAWVHPAPWMTGAVMLAACGVASLLFARANRRSAPIETKIGVRAVDSAVDQPGRDPAAR